MEKDFRENRHYSRLYQYSLRYIPYSWLSKLGLNQINPNAIKNFLNTYGFAVLVGLLIYFPTSMYNSIPDKTLFYLMYLMLVGWSAWLGRLYGAFLTTTIITAQIIFFFKPIEQSQLVVFIITASIISYIIDKSLRSKAVEQLKIDEKIYAQNLMQLDQEFTKARGEITSRDEFLSIASHELKTPLTSMLLKLHSMINDIRNESLANFSVSKLMGVLENAEEQIKLLATMINDLLNVSLITTGHMKLECEEADLVKIAKHITQNFSEVLKQKKYKLKTDYPSPVMGVWDKNRIEQVISNLLSNAIKYGAGKPITIKVSNSGSTGKFIIQDQGIGIDRKDQKILFQRFKRVADKKEYTKGLGVGLYVTDQIVRAHGGTIKVSSSLNKGSTFSIELPLNNPKK